MIVQARWLAVLLAIACDRTATEAAPAPSEPKVAEPAKAEPAAKLEPAAKVEDPVVGAAAVITPVSLKRVVEALASDTLGGRRTPSPGLDAAAQIIVDEYKRIGLSAPAEASAHVQRFDCSGRGVGSSSNVIGVIKGSDPKLAQQHVIVSAHYDHLGSTSDSEGLGRASAGDAVFNGANDDASGVAAMLGVAEALAKTSPKRSIAFIAFCGEELGMRGSQWWVDHPLVPLGDTVAVVNLEMLGRPEKDRPTRLWMTGKARSTMGDMMAAAAKDVGMEIVDGGEVGEFMGKLFDKSDNWSFASKGVVAHSISTGVIDDLYHSVEDEIATLDFDAMAPQVRAIAVGTWRIADGADAPAWTADGRPAG